MIESIAGPLKSMVNVTSDCSSTLLGDLAIEAPSFSRAGYLDALRFHTVSGKLHARLQAMGVPINPSPRKPTRILVVDSN